MALILDTYRFPTGSYRARLQEALFTAVIKELPNHQFWVPSTPTLPNISAFSNVNTVPFPAQTGLLAASKTRKWLQQCQASQFISLHRTLKTKVPLRQVRIADPVPAVTEFREITSADFTGWCSPWGQQEFIKNHPHSSSCLLNGFWPRLTVPDEFDNQLVKHSLTGGREYFICTDLHLNTPAFITLLKGFSHFKKRLQSSWKLVVVLRSGEAISPSEAEKLMAAYKFRQDVTLTTEDDLFAKLKGAYCLVSLNKEERFPLEIEEAAQTKTPIITQSTQSLESLYKGDNFIRISDANSENIGEQLMRLYKSESLRAQMAAAAATIEEALAGSNGLDIFIGQLKQKQAE